MEIVSTIATIVTILKAVKEAIDAATDVVESVDNFIVTFRKTVDDFKNTVTEVVVMFDSDGDGENDREEVVYKIYQTLPDFETGLCICNKGDEIGLGLPMFKIVDGTEFGDLLAEAPSVPLADLPDLPVLPDTSDITDLPELPELPVIRKEYPIVTANDKYLLYDVNNDGSNEIVMVYADVTGDGINDFLVGVDEDDNGLLDASSNYEFYPVGSEAFEYLIEGIETEDSIMTKEIDQYSVAEGLLALILLFSVINFIRGLFVRRDYLR